MDDMPYDISLLLATVLIVLCALTDYWNDRDLVVVMFEHP